jgi:hypothetical protein
MKTKDQILLEETYLKIISENNPDAMELDVSQFLFKNPEYLDLHRSLIRFYRVFKTAKSEEDRIKIDAAIKNTLKKMRNMEMETMEDKI